MSHKSLVLVVGASGATAKSIMQGLLESKNFRLASIVRPASVSKPEVERLRALGVDIRLANLDDGVEKLANVIQDVDVIISAVNAWVVLHQKDLIRAAKQVGVQRFIPCDFATPGAKGVRTLTDNKFAIHDFIQSLGLPHTYIDVGWWMQLYLPIPTRSGLSPEVAGMPNTLYNSGDQANLLTDLRNIGKWVACIVADDRTLNRSVIVWEDIVPQARAFEIADRVSDEGDAFRASRNKLSREDMQNIINVAAADVEANPNDTSAIRRRGWMQYQFSMHVIGENTLENAKRLGYLNAKELYPDIPQLTLENFAKDFYAMEDPGVEYKRA